MTEDVARQEEDQRRVKPFYALASKGNKERIRKTSDRWVDEIK